MSTDGGVLRRWPGRQDSQSGGDRAFLPSPTQPPRRAILPAGARPPEAHLRYV